MFVAILVSPIFDTVSVCCRYRYIKIPTWYLDRYIDSKRRLLRQDASPPFFITCKDVKDDMHRAYFQDSMDSFDFKLLISCWFGMYQFSSILASQFHPFPVSKHFPMLELNEPDEPAAEAELPIAGWLLVFRWSQRPQLSNLRRQD